MSPVKLAEVTLVLQGKVSLAEVQCSGFLTMLLLSCPTTSVGRTGLGAALYHICIVVQNNLICSVNKVLRFPFTSFLMENTSLI